MTLCALLFSYRNLIRESIDHPMVTCYLALHSLLVSQLRLAAHCDVQHNELVLLEADGKLDRGELDARGGVIAGNVVMIGAQTHGVFPIDFRNP